MFESAGGDFGTWLSNLFGSSGGAVNALGTNDPNLGPTSWTSGGEATWNPSSSTGGTDWNKVSSALKSLGGGSKGTSSSDSSGSSSSQNAALGQSAGIGRGGGTSGLDSIINAMNQRRNLFFVGGGGRSGSSGLLG